MGEKSTGKKFPFIENFGRQVGLTDRAYARLSLFACNQAARGEIGPEDAGPLLGMFKESRRRGAGLAKQADPPGAQQISKFRKVVEVGAYFKKQGVAMIKQAQDLHIKEFQVMPDDQLTYEGEYNLVVQVAREALKRGKPLSKDEIKDIAIKR